MKIRSKNNGDMYLPEVLAITYMKIKCCRAFKQYNINYMYYNYNFRVNISK